MKHPVASRRQRGFTLVEIAIVLMIVGLLIGGILRGQELITSARVRNIIDQKSAVQAAYTGFLDRYRMLPGDLTLAQAPQVEGTAVASANSGNGLIDNTKESTLFFQNLTASGFLSCGGCMSVTSPVGTALIGPTPSIDNSPVNVYGDFLTIGHVAGSATPDTAPVTFGWFETGGQTRLVLLTGGSVPSQVLAEADRKADDGRPGTGQLRYGIGGTVAGGVSGSRAGCAASGVGIVSTANVTTALWTMPSQANCQGAWLF